MYTNEWYDQYRKHLEEPRVRQRHNDMFNIFSLMSGGLKHSLFVVDLGCATQEYYKYGYCQKYFGIDINFLEYESIPDYYKFANDPAIKIAKLGDYLKEPIKNYCPFQPNAFVSIFSTEIIMPPKEKYEFYEKIFVENPSVQVGMVAGFYYEDSKDQESVVETSVQYNDVVYQTVENQLHYQSKVFEEYRTYVYAPSELFGDKITECWKFFRRKV